MPPRSGSSGESGGTTRPYTLVAELSYQCPLHCPYCSNPVLLERSAEREAVERAGVEVAHDGLEVEL